MKIDEFDHVGAGACLQGSVASTWHSYNICSTYAICTTYIQHMQCATPAVKSSFSSRGMFAGQRGEEIALTDQAARLHPNVQLPQGYVTLPSLPFLPSGLLPPLQVPPPSQTLPRPYTLHPSPYTLHPTPYTPHPATDTLHPTPLLLTDQAARLHPTVQLPQGSVPL